MIESLTCDIWRTFPYMDIVIPTNIGWTKEGKNVMGAGIALQAAKRESWVPELVGKWYKDGERGVFEVGGFIFFPTKPLNEKAPWLSWQGSSTLERVEESAEQLSKLYNLTIDCPVAVPLVGCGNGRLSEEKVLPILRKYLDDQFILVRQP